MVDLVEETLERAASERPHGKGPVQPEAQGADRRAAGSWGETLVIWHNLENPEGGGQVCP